MKSQIPNPALSAGRRPIFSVFKTVLSKEGQTTIQGFVVLSVEKFLNYITDLILKYIVDHVKDTCWGKLIFSDMGKLKKAMASLVQICGAINNCHFRQALIKFKTKTRDKRLLVRWLPWQIGTLMLNFHWLSCSSFFLRLLLNIFWEAKMNGREEAVPRWRVFIVS